MSIRTRLAVVLLAGALVPDKSAWSQTPRDSARADSAAQKLKAVTVTETRAAGATGGASAVVIKPQELRSSPAPLLEDALRESPFVHVRQNSRGEMEISVRGSDSRQAAVLLDGVPITLGFDHRTDPSLVPITGAQNLVIVRGLSSLLNGPNTLGGTIEVSHDNAFGQLGAGRIWGGVGVDENAAYVASIGGGRKVTDFWGGSLSLRGGVARRERDGFALPKAAPDPTATNGLRTNSDLRETDGFGTLRWSGAMGRSLGLMVTGFSAERGVPPEEHIATPRLWRYPHHSRAIAALSGNAGSFSTPLGFGSFEFGVGYNTGRQKIQSYNDRSYQTVTGEELGDERTWTSRALFTHSLPRSARVKTAVTMASVSYAETLPPAAVADYQQRLWSAGAEVEVPLTFRTTFATGLVYDESTTPKTGGRTPGQEAFNNFGWRAGLTHEVNAEWRLHASASQRSRFPSLRELYSGALNRFKPNPDLEPETLLGFEAGFTVDRSLGPIPDATAQVNVFHHNLENGVVRITLPPDGRFQRINRDRIESTGAELLAGLVFGANRDRSVSLTGDALVQNVDVIEQTSGGRLSRHAENNPEVRGMIELGVPLPGMRAFANARLTGTQYCLNADTGSEMTLDAKAESNFALEKRIAVSQRGAVRAVRALLSLDNATNVAIYDQCGLPQPGRTLRLMFTMQ
ncbi:MAG: TonB-dependent receptor [Gemmatimonadaceae bacterium]